MAQKRSTTVAAIVAAPLVVVRSAVTASAPKVLAGSALGVRSTSASLAPALASAWTIGVASAPLAPADDEDAIGERRHGA